MGYRDKDGNIVMEYIDMTKATYQYIHDSVVTYCDISEIMKCLKDEKTPEAREELYRKLILEEYLNEDCELSFWSYHGDEKEATTFVTISDIVIPKAIFEGMEYTVLDYTHESVIEQACMGAKDESERDSYYISFIVEDALREYAMSVALGSRHDDEEFDDVVRRHFY